MSIKFLHHKTGITFILLVILCVHKDCLIAQGADKNAVLKYLSGLSEKQSGRLISGQFESWGSAVKPLDDEENYLNLVHRKTGKWVGLVGAEYHNGTQVHYEGANQLFERYWEEGGFCQLYLIMSNPSDSTSFNGGGRCDLKLVSRPGHAFNRYFYRELDQVAEGLKQLQKKHVVVFLNMFPEATADWFWWGGQHEADFIALYRNAYDYLVTTKGLDNLLFIYEPCAGDNLALKYYPGDKYVDIIGFSLFTDYDKEIDSFSIRSYREMEKTGKPMGISQWGPRRGKDQTGSVDQPPADNLKLLRGIQKYFPKIVWWMNWNCAYSISNEQNSNYNGSALLNQEWVTMVRYKII